VELHHAERHGEADAGASRLGGVEEGKDSFLRIGGNAHAGIAYFEFDGVGHGVGGVIVNSPPWGIAWQPFNTKFSSKRSVDLQTRSALRLLRRGKFHILLGNIVRYIFSARIPIDGGFHMSHLARRDFLKNLLAASSAAFIPARTRGVTETAAALRIFKVGAISDGFSDDFEEALKLMKGYGLEWVEIRHLWGRVYNTEASPEQIRRIRELLDRYGFRVSVVSTALYKCALPGTKPLGNPKDAYPYSEQMDLLKRAAERAHAWGTDTLRVFAFWRVAEPEKIAGRVAEELEKAAAVARSAGVRLAIEDEGACNVRTGHELAQLLASVKAPNVGATWDVGNPWFSGEVSFPSGYEVLPKNRIWHVHVKGVACEAPGKQCRNAFADQGSIDLAGQLRALRRDHYTGTISLECEYSAPGMSHLQTTQRSMEGLLKVAAEAAA